MDASPFLRTLKVGDTIGKAMRAVPANVFKCRSQALL
jgi:hypothetical protein